MTAADRRLSRYLLGELVESEREAFEREYFTDAKLFGELLAEESDLLDTYVRGGLSPETRRLLELHRLSDPRGQERLEVASALAARADVLARPVSERRAAGNYWRGAVAASLVIAAAGGWLLFETARLRRDLAVARRDAASSQQQARDLEKQVASERNRIDELSGEVERLRGVGAGALPPVVALLLNLRGTRSAAGDSTPTLAVSPSTSAIRLDVSLGRADYRQYRLALQSADGTPILRRDHVVPSITAGDARLTMDVPRRSLADADYVLTVSGETAAGSGDDIGRAMFRVRYK